MRSSTKSILISAATLLILLTFLGLANAWTLSGTVYGGGNPLPGATLTLIDAATSTPLATSDSSTVGGYSFSAPDGNYNLSIRPPAGSGFNDSVINGILVAGADATHDFVLVANALTLSGTVYGASGTPLPNVKVYLYPKGSSNELASTLTDAQGRYTFGVSTGEYTFSLEHYGRDWGGATLPGAEPSECWRVFGVGPVTVAASTTYAIRLPFARLSGKTTDADGTVIGGATINCTLQGTSWTDDNGVPQSPYIDGTSKGASDSEGNYSIVVTTGPGSLTLTPPPVGFTLPLTILRIDIATDTVKNLVFLSSGNLTGTIYGAGGIPLPNVSLSVRSQNDASTNATLKSDAQGRYRMVIPPGDYVFSLEHYGAPWGGVTIPTAEPSKFWRIFGVGPVTVAGDLVYDLHLPFARLSGKTVDASGSALHDVAISHSLQGTVWTSNGGTVQAAPYIDGNSEASSDAEGNYGIVIATGNASVTLTPPTGSSLPLTILPINITTNTVRNLVLQSSGNLTGTIYGASQLKIPNVAIHIKSKSAASVNADLTTDAEGGYSVVIPPGEYVIDLEHYGAAWGGQTIPDREPGNFWRVYGLGPVTVTEKKTYDIPLPFVRFTGKTTDTNGVPIQGVRLFSSLKSASWTDADGVTQSPYVDGSSEGLSDPLGKYLLVVTKGADQVAISPPERSGFALTNVMNLNASTDKVLDCILPFVDNAPPVILSGPVVTSITESTAAIHWQSNEPAKGTVLYNSGTADIGLAESTFSNDHVLPLTGLAPNTTYSVRVTASDVAGNGPATSKIVTFTTKSIPDANPPVILTGPVITDITHDSATVEWSTDEPTVGSLSYGPGTVTDQVVKDSLLMTRHRVLLTGLAPETLYNLRTEAFDAANNGPTASQTISFRTVAAPDTVPPVIIEGPMAIDVTGNSATIVWKTDEPSSSGVSWNDGTVYGVLSDDAMTNYHALRITGLTPSTSYQFTASSKDFFGNGPTLSVAASFTTRPVPDNKPPVFTYDPVIKNVTHNMALIYWETDEPADSVIEYGTGATDTTIDAQAGLRTKHNRTLTGLLPGTTYYFRVMGTDASSNGPSTSQKYSFTTAPLPQSQAPVITNAPVIVYSTDRAATVYFDTDKPCDTIVEYGVGNVLTNRQSDAEKVNKHQATITNLTPETSYAIEVSCTDMQGNSTTKVTGKRLASPASYTTLVTAAASDTTSPVINTTPAVTSLWPNQATIVWTTDEISDSQVLYRQEGDSVTLTAGDIVQVSTHSTVLTNLTPGATYRFMVRSVDPSNNSVTSSSFSFNTPLSIKPGDADHDGVVAISEIQRAIKMFLGLEAPLPAMDLDQNNLVSISEVQKVIKGFLGL